MFEMFKPDFRIGTDSSSRDPVDRSPSVFRRSSVFDVGKTKNRLRVFVLLEDQRHPRHQELAPQLPDQHRHGRIGLSGKTTFAIRSDRFDFSVNLFYPLKSINW